MAEKNRDLRELDINTTWGSKRNDFRTPAQKQQDSKTAGAAAGRGKRSI